MWLSSQGFLEHISVSRCLASPTSIGRSGATLTTIQWLVWLPLCSAFRSAQSAVSSLSVLCSFTGTLLRVSGGNQTDPLPTNSVICVTATATLQSELHPSAEHIS